MKLLGIHRIDGGVAIALPSGRQFLLALPHDRARAASVLGRRILKLVDDPDEPHTSRNDAAGGRGQGDDQEPDHALATLDAGIEAGRLVWRTLQCVSRGKR